MSTTRQKHPSEPAGPKMHAVGSKMIQAMGWEPSRPKSDRGTLHVQFSDGVTWEYDDVQNDQWKLFHGSPSKGTFFHRSIKPHFAGRRRGEG